MACDLLDRLGVSLSNNESTYAEKWLDLCFTDKNITSYNPATGKPISNVMLSGTVECDHVIETAHRVFGSWRMIPAPRRGDIIREIGNELRRFKNDLGALVSLETGKILAEGEGEVQEMIDLADFAVGLSRQLYGLTMPSERAEHRIYEQWHPLGVVGVITAFNFPVAVWAWNAFIAAVCGDTVVWKPSLKTPLTAIAVQHICNRVFDRHNLSGVFNLCIGESAVVGETLIADRRVPLISATGSCHMGNHVAQVVAGRFGKTILELGGNNAVIVMDDADLDLTVPAILFGAVGTAGQRCTTIRRVIVHENIADELTERLVQAYKQVTIGDPLDSQTLMGPLIDQVAVTNMMQALNQIKDQGGKILCGGNTLDGPGFFVEPTIVEAHKDMEIIQEETFAPILYILRFRTLDEAINIHNDVPQGLSSAIFTTDLRASEQFLSAAGSDCGIANVNMSTSGAEIGGAFGGEKDTGGGRESGSDAWKAYMRRQTVGICYARENPELAQGIKFE